MKNVTPKKCMLWCNYGICHAVGGCGKVATPVCSGAEILLMHATDRVPLKSAEHRAHWNSPRVSSMFQAVAAAD